MLCEKRINQMRKWLDKTGSADNWRDKMALVLYAKKNGERIPLPNIIATKRYPHTDNVADYLCNLKGADKVPLVVGFYGIVKYVTRSAPNRVDGRLLYRLLCGFILYIYNSAAGDNVMYPNVFFCESPNTQYEDYTSQIIDLAIDMARAARLMQNPNDSRETILEEDLDSYMDYEEAAYEEEGTFEDYFDGYDEDAFWLDGIVPVKDNFRLSSCLDVYQDMKYHSQHPKVHQWNFKSEEYPLFLKYLNKSTLSNLTWSGVFDIMQSMFGLSLTEGVLGDVRCYHLYRKCMIEKIPDDIADEQERAVLERYIAFDPLAYIRKQCNTSTPDSIRKGIEVLLDDADTSFVTEGSGCYARSPYLDNGTVDTELDADRCTCVSSVYDKSVEEILEMITISVRAEQILLRHQCKDDVRLCI